MSLEDFMIEKLKKAEILALDFETGFEKIEETNLIKMDKIVLFSVAVRVGKKYYSEAYGYDRFKEVWNIIKKKRIVFHNAKFDLKVLKNQKINIEKVRYEDTLIMAYLLDEDRRKGLKELRVSVLGLERRASYDEVDKENSREFIKYAKSDAEDTLRLYDNFAPQIIEEGLEIVYELEKRCVLPVIELEDNGARVDVKLASKQEQELTQKIRDIEIAVEKIIKYKINLNSSKQVGDLIFRVLKYPPLEEWKGKSGNYSTGSAVLDYISRDKSKSHKMPIKIASMLSMQRQYQKLLTGFINPILQRNKDGIIYPNFNQVLTVSGRFCVSGDTVLETNLGSIAISKLCLTKGSEHSIVTHRGRWRKITDKCFKGYEEMYRVTLKNGSHIDCTQNHRFLTLDGWRSLHEIKRGEKVRIAGYQNPLCGEKQKLGSLRRGFCEIFNRERVVNRGVLKENRTASPYLGHFKGILSRVEERIRHSFKKNKVEEKCESDAGKCQRREGTPIHSFRQKGFRTKNKSGEEGSNYSQRNGCERVFSQKEYSLSQVRSNDTFSSHKASKCGYRVFREIEDFCSVFSRGCFKFWRRSREVFQQLIYNFFEFNANGLFYKRSSKEFSEINRIGDNSEREYKFSHQRVGDKVSISFGRFKNKICALFFLQQEYVGGFLYNGEEFNNRGRWLLARLEKSNRERPKERLDYKKVRLPVKEIYDSRHKEKIGVGVERYSTSEIESIESIGIKGVWDISVEEDHSYIAQGFINHNSSSGPNLQNIPTGDKAYEKDNPFSSVRALFDCNEDEYFFAADYSQIELRMMAELSKDKYMCQAYIDDADIHEVTAQALIISRKNAKVVNFGIGYGMTSPRLASFINVPIGKAQALIDGYWNNYRGLFQFTKNLEKTAGDVGFIKSISGRKRRFKIYDQGAMRQTLNFVIQGSCADLMKMALVRFHSLIDKKQCIAEMTVHDEICGRVKKSYAEEAMEIVKYSLESVLETYVPIIANIKIGRRWSETK